MHCIDNKNISQIFFWFSSCQIFQIQNSAKSEYNFGIFLNTICKSRDQFTNNYKWTKTLLFQYSGRNGWDLKITCQFSWFFY